MYQVYDTKLKQMVDCPSGHPVAMPGFDSVEFFIHRTYRSHNHSYTNAGWMLSEVKTGMFLWTSDATQLSDALIDFAGKARKSFRMGGTQESVLQNIARELERRANGTE